MQLLFDERFKTPRPLLGAVISAATHVALIAIVAIGGRRYASDIADVMQQTVRFLVPADRISRPVETQLKYAGSPGNDAKSGLRPSEHITRTTSSTAFAQPQAASQGDDARTSLAVAEPTAEENAYSVLDVDSAAVRDPASAAPSYPETLMAQNVEGSATMRFVVDTTGYVDMATVKEIRTTHPLFAKAVRDVMPRMRFRPALAGNRAVRQLAEQEFKFLLQRAVAKKPQ